MLVLAFALVFQSIAFLFLLSGPCLNLLDTSIMNLDALSDVMSHLFQTSLEQSLVLMICEVFCSIKYLNSKNVLRQILDVVDHYQQKGEGSTIIKCRIRQQVSWFVWIGCIALFCAMNSATLCLLFCCVPSLLSAK